MRCTAALAAMTVPSLIRASTNPLMSLSTNTAGGSVCVYVTTWSIVLGPMPWYWFSWVPHGPVTRLVSAAVNCAAEGLVDPLAQALPQNTRETRAAVRTGPPPSCSEVTFGASAAAGAAGAGLATPGTPPCGLVVCASVRAPVCASGCASRSVMLSPRCRQASPWWRRSPFQSLAG